MGDLERLYLVRPEFEPQCWNLTLVTWGRLFDHWKIQVSICIMGVWMRAPQICRGRERRHVGDSAQWLAQDERSGVVAVVLDTR